MLTLTGKYDSVARFVAARLYREFVRAQLRPLIHWGRLSSPSPGLTVIIGMCSRLPAVLAANLRFLEQAAAQWPAVKEVIIAVDGTRASLAPGLEEETLKKFAKLHLRFFYYSEGQARVTERLKLPFVYSWLSWSTCLAEVTTEHALIHDYDALVLGHGLQRRYERFRASGAKVQGVSWYQGNGVAQTDRLATTFEAFVDVRWLRSFEPIALFNQVRIRKGRSVDYDTLLDMQENHTQVADRDVDPMALDELVHPSQMIHQFTMFRKFPGGELPCFSIIMIPVFMYLGGDTSALDRATQQLRDEGARAVHLLGDDTLFNLKELDRQVVDWIVKQSVAACMGLGLPPDPALVRYGSALYEAAGTKAREAWIGDFTPAQARWLDEAGRPARG